MSNIFDKLFKRKTQIQTKETKSLSFENGIEAYQKGCVHADNGEYEDALKCFDFAIDCGIKEAYQERGLCLNSLDYFLDAIDDFNKAIQLTPEDCNLYYCRGL